jgi:hypothetical protein
MMRRLNFIVIGMALLIAGCTMGPTTNGPVITPGPTPTTAVPVVEGSILSAELLQSVSRATVQIIAAQDSGGSLQPTKTGSGVLISASGQIVTTCTVACDAPILIVLLTTDVNVAPEALYRAQVTASDTNLNLATLQITQNAAGNPVDSGTLNLPFLQRIDSNTLNQGDRLQILSYPATSGTTVKVAAGAISSIGSGQVGGSEQRMVINTDANLGISASGGAAVNTLGQLVGIPTTVDPTGAQSLGSGTLLLPVNLMNNIGQGVATGTGGSGPLDGDTTGGGDTGGGDTRQPPIVVLDKFEPNNNFNEASGPITSGQGVQAYIGTDDDVDIFYFEATTTSPISVELTDIPSGSDYDVYVYFNSNVVGQSENQNQSDESLEFRPASPGRFYVAVNSFRSSNDSEPYALTVDYDSSVGGSSGGSAVRVSGTIIDGHTGRAFDRGVFGILNPGVTCDQFFGAASLDMSLVTANVATDSSTGNFSLVGVPSGEDYAAFFFTGGDHVCQNNWLDVPAGGGDVELDPITLAF